MKAEVGVKRCRKCFKDTGILKRTLKLSGRSMHKGGVGILKMDNADEWDLTDEYDKTGKGEFELAST